MDYVCMLGYLLKVNLQKSKKLLKVVYEKAHHDWWDSFGLRKE